ncbi:MAG: hypothetical protein ACOY90_05540 [Candidatus Zhuqueibacterota bacterium]
MEISKIDIIFYLIITFFSIYSILFVYIVLRLRTYIPKLLDILLRIDAAVKQPLPHQQKETEKPARSCKNCKNRLPFYFSDPGYESYFYYRCRLTQKQVPPDYSCNKFILDPQTYDV